MGWLRASLHVWRLAVLWLVCFPAVWLAQLALSAIMLSWAHISVEFPSASSEMDEWLHGPRAPALEDEITEPRPRHDEDTKVD